MAFLNSCGSKYQPYVANESKDRTPKKVDWLQTTGTSGATTTTEIFADATASDDFHLTSLTLSITAPTAGAELSVYVGTTQIAQFPTCAADVCYHYHLNFGDVGVQGGTTTTATVSIKATATLTTRFLAIGYRDL